MAYHKVDVSGTHRVPVHSLEELPGRAIGRERVGGGPKAVESVLSLVVGLELAAEVVVCEHRVLEVVLAVAAGLPHVEGDVGDGLVGDEIADDAVHVSDLALVVVLDDRVAELAPGGVGRPEGAEDCGGGGLVFGVVGWDVVGDLSNKAGFRVSCRSFLCISFINGERLTIQGQQGHTFCASRCACRSTRPRSCRPG